MKKVFIFIKNYWLLIFIILALVLFIANKFIKGPQQVSNTPTPSTNKIARFGEISPGTTSIERVNEILGQPVKTENTSKGETYDYRTSNRYIFDQVIASDNIVKFVKEAVIFGEKINADTIKKDYGVAPYILYEQVPNSVFNLYVYPQNGIAYLGHEDGTVMEIWYFEPTAIDNFISKWASNYSPNKFTGQSKY